MTSLDPEHGRRMDRLVNEILRAEGWPRYTNYAEDRGGPTRGGVTLKALARHRGAPVNIADLKALTKAEAREIYALVYVMDPGFYRVDDRRLLHHVVDCGVLHGPSQAVRWMQRAIGGLKVDGDFGPRTLDALADADPRVVSLKIAVERLNFIARLVDRKNRQVRFLKGWVRRATGFVTEEAER